jgi:preprotein translocase subunit SecA
MVTNAIKSAQSQVEAQNFEIRKNVLKYDDVLNRQRKVIYDERRRVLEGADLHEQVRHMIDDTVEAYVQGATNEGFPEDWDLEQLWVALKTLYPVSFSINDLEQRAGGERSGLTAEFIAEEVKADAHAAYDTREAELGEEMARELERRVVLSVLDRKWREHLYEMDYLQEGIGLRAMAQRDPLVEYQREGFDLFAAMMDGIKEESVGYLFHVEVQVEAEPPVQAGLDEVEGVDDIPLPGDTLPAVGRAAQPLLVAKGLAEPKRPARLEYSAPTLDGQAGVAHQQDDAQGDPLADLPEDATRADRRRAMREARKRGGR